MSEEKKLQNKLTLSPVTLTLYMLGGMFPAGFVLVITGYYFMYFMTDRPCSHGILSNSVVEAAFHGCVRYDH